MAKTINIPEAKTHLSRLVDEAAAGAEIIIAKAGKPMARLAPLDDDTLTCT
jgi:prevent-host-death family protein